MKTVYFVRHGQSEGNIRHGFVGQLPQEPLTQKGQEQAEFIAKRIKNLPVDIIVSSTYKRALDTAKSIQKAVGVNLIESDLFVERKRPSVLIGKSWEDDDVLKFNQLAQKNYHNPDFRYDDEDTFEDLNRRAKEALTFLESLKEENIVVTTHGFFLRILIARITLGASLNSKSGEKFIETFHHENTGLTIVKKDEERDNWFLWMWNDHAHLA